MMATERTLNDLFLDTLKDIYFAEQQIVKALPNMARETTLRRFLTRTWPKK
jgi:ferritin-like metal-binding protein YciE